MEKEQQAEQIKMYKRHISAVKEELTAQIKTSNPAAGTDFSNPYIVAEMRVTQTISRSRRNASPTMGEQTGDMSVVANKTSSIYAVITTLL